MNGYVYMLIDRRNGKKYIGKHIGNNVNYYTGGKIPKLIIRKYGKEVFERIILEDNIKSKEILSERERYYIELHDSFNNGYNLTGGGDGGGEWILKKTPEELQRISDSKRKWNLKNKIVTEETKEKLRKAHTGKVLTSEHRSKVVKNLMLYRINKHSEETKQKLRIIHTGTKASQETKDKMSKTRTGKSIPGMSERLRENNPKAQQVSINNIKYKTIRAAAEALGMKEDTVRARINSKSSKFNNWIRID